MKSVLVAVAVLLASGWASAQEDPGVEVNGVVVDAAGKPVANADVATFYIFEGDNAFPCDGTKSGADGTFRLKVQAYGQPFALMTLDAERKRAGVATAGPEAPKGQLLLTLAPALKVRGKFSCKALGGKPEWTMVYAYSWNKKTRVGQCDSTDAQFSMILPDTAWTLDMYGTDIEGIDRVVESKKGKLDLDLGVIDFEATFLAKHYGKPLPAWTLSDARGARKEVQLSDYRGKWVLLEFWGFW